MNPTMDLANDHPEIHEGAFTRWSATERLVLALTALGTIVSRWRF